MPLENEMVLGQLVADRAEKTPRMSNFLDNTLSQIIGVTCVDSFGAFLFRQRLASAQRRLNLSASHDPGTCEALSHSDRHQFSETRQRVDRRESHAQGRARRAHFHDAGRRSRLSLPMQAALN
jgi:hypothetical protein